ncbi:PREDICTED: uncharacterized protein LOC105972206 [Erythranthe guttata]|uniref:uncharacterized protein LOC105972206 n=1 Tax=Erythranthe guttata TaxID=4155 RepID=UPI00064DE43A|nr:PREDICTED: uncharacterized protein LOC105972206 [Erythranthe guttata]|eukprot:XP_012852597.1 PREDICTED: uncharacterized protein LOC105972206 [Erythranthe guttata]
MAPLSNGANGNENGYKTPRHPRWTRRETMVLIEGKKIAEERGGRRGRRSGSVNGSTQVHVEPKWDYVSSHCKRNGVTRGPVQCRKRWSNLVSDFKKIKAWEGNKVINGDGGEGGGESFWLMRSDLRREIKLPGFFDRDVFDVLDGKAFATNDGYQLALVTINTDENNGEDDDEDFEEENERSPVSSPVPISGAVNIRIVDYFIYIYIILTFFVLLAEMKYQPFYQAESSQGKYISSENKRQPGPHFNGGSDFQEGAKRRRQSSSDSRNSDVEDLLVKALERNTNLLNAHFDEQKLNFQLDRDRQNSQHDSLIAALTKVTDALEKIANKL